MRIRENLTVVFEEEETGKPLAYSYDASAFSSTALEIILLNQITSPDPLDIHYRIDDGAVYYQTIEAKEFKRLRTLKQSVREQFIKGKVKRLKQLSTQEIIFSTPNHAPKTAK